MVSERYQIFDVRELSVASHQCATCGTVVSFDMAAEDRFGLPRRCSTCNEPLGTAAAAFVAYRDFYKAALAAGSGFRIRTKAES